MKNKLVLGFLVFGATVFAAGNTYKVHISQDSVIEGKPVKAGSYKIVLENNGNAVLKDRQNSIQVAARAETEPHKVSSTELLYKNNTDLQGIRIGGTTTAILFQHGGTARAGA
ncbi:MAG TPA: hypothetical protein VG273_21425 [Bryobacteraceae bacterium]|nr:hypothetical protein [Bryobacteraceae bacterium]